MSWIWSNSPYRGERLLLHLALGDFANDEGECFPSVATLARKARCSDVWCRAGIREMIKDDLLEIVAHGNGRGRSNRYRLKRVSEKLESGLPVSDKGVSVATERGKSGESDSSYLNNHQEPSSSFDRFWSVYPKKVAKGHARKAFDKIMSRKDAPSIDLLCDAAEAYGKAISDPRYIAHPATWLNGERWLDAPGRKADAKVETGADRSASSFGAALALIGKTEQELIEQVEHYDSARREAAIRAFRETREARQA